MIQQISTVADGCIKHFIAKINEIAGQILHDS